MTHYYRIYETFGNCYVNTILFWLWNLSVPISEIHLLHFKLIYFSYWYIRRIEHCAAHCKIQLVVVCFFFSYDTYLIESHCMSACMRLLSASPSIDGNRSRPIKFCASNKQDLFRIRVIEVAELDSDASFACKLLKCMFEAKNRLYHCDQHGSVYSCSYR